MATQSNERDDTGVNRTNKALGLVIARLRQVAGLSQEELADRAKIHRTYVSQLERGLKAPTTTILFSLSSALQSSPSKILKLTEQELSDV